MQKFGSHRVNWQTAIFSAVLILFSTARILQGQIFVVGESSGTVGEYSLSGAPLNASLITGLIGPWQLAVNGNDLFLSDTELALINEYSSVGTLLNPNFLPNAPGGIALAAAGGDIFLANYEGPLAEYTASGDLVNASLGTPIPGAQVVAVQGNDIFVSSALPRTYLPVKGDPQYIGEFTTSGVTINSDLLTISEMSSFTVDGSDLFVTTYAGDVAEYTTSGTLLTPSLISGLGDPTAIAVLGDNLLIATSGSISEFTTSGTLVNPSLISGVGTVYGLTVVVPEPATFAMLAVACGGLLLRRPNLWQLPEDLK